MHKIAHYNFKMFLDHKPGPLSIWRRTTIH